jgi:hypothetical protein
MRVPLKDSNGQTYWQEVEVSNKLPQDLERALAILKIDPESIVECVWNLDRGGYDVRVAPYAGAVTMLINVVPLTEGDQSDDK